MSTAYKLRITTCVNPDECVLDYVSMIVKDLENYHSETRVIIRGKKTVKSFFSESDIPLLIIQKNGIILYTQIDNKISYQESTMNIKYKQYVKTGVLPPLVAAVSDNADASLLIADCTMGLGNDLMLMARILQHANFYAYEQNFYIHFAIKWSMNYYCNVINPELSAAYHSINFVFGSIEQEATQFDVIYVDCLYKNTVDSSNISPLVTFLTGDKQNEKALLDDVVRRDAKVVLRAEYNSPLISQYPFEMNIRRNTITHYGILKK
ncbi:hypothetical protein [Macrococcoides canis]|uniref:hypothetical protein n=1 Tax=Macrococcoides canis TaxID=1855823 RepID=UPI001B8CE2F3|nr:hypothetical protein [Macrococcus canis]MCO4095437.1 hypothetical protein [Macrococcus canis]QUR93450.1 hypothetical protein GOY09_00225 [Macrococcus canis]UTH05888.1 hypothetical protein KFV07_06725 [Macrococcus canis]UTH08162.1 hypothetical protein KFV08_06370 [Macrococcus canis]